jgi:hypothetical protein
MSDDVDEPWASDADIMDLTDTDIEAKRTMHTKISDTSGELHRLVETLRRHEGLDARSATCDRALRVELAHAIDNHLVTFDRDTHDVAYTIPPAGWLQQRVFSEVTLLDEGEMNVDTRAIGFTTPDVVHDMARDAVDNDEAYETLSEIVMNGTKRLLGRT